MSPTPSHTKWDRHDDRDAWPTFDLEYTIVSMSGIDYVHIQPVDAFPGVYSPWIAITEGSAVPFEEIP
jgi:hypothetical protein